MKCIICGKPAEYVFILFGTGGSFCEECYKEVKKGLGKKVKEFEATILEEAKREAERK
jgi:recombinational DNA repair protein (RecF pathway)